MMQPALHLKTTIMPGSKIEITDIKLPPGEFVDVFILLPSSSAVKRRSAIDILAQAPGQRLFKTPAQVDAYLKEERDSWER